MIPTNLKIWLCFLVVIYFIIILYLLKKKSLELKYTLIWLFAGVVLGILLLFPQLMKVITRFLGIIDSMNALFLVAIGFVVAILMMLTSIVSNQSKKIRRLIQEVAILEKKLIELEKKNESFSNINNL